MSTDKSRIEIVAQALWANRVKDALLNWKGQSWGDFLLHKPDIAKIYLENARIAIDALEKASAS